MTIKVQLRAAKIPKIGFLAVHYYYVIIRENKADRWEIWQNAALIPSSWGHLHKNLLSVNSGVGNGGSWLEKSWTGEMAEKLGHIIENSPYSYPYNYFYLYFPGPNSNTYVQWVLKQANCNHPLSFRGIGKYY
jgi:uncharacterized protein YbdZ (MbtH family)